MIADLVLAANEGPDPNDVVAGWTGFAIFVALAVAVGLLGWSLTRQLKKVDRAEEQGLYDPSPKKQRESHDESAGP